MEYQRESTQLAEYEEHYQAKMAQFEQEAEDLMKLEQFMISTANRIESTVKEKKLCIEK